MRLLTDLYDYQAQAVDKLSRVKVGALYMEMGTGKTRTALELIQRRLQAGKVQQALWMCPYSVSRDLPELLAEHAEDFESVIRIAGIESLSNSTRIYGELLCYVRRKPTFLVVDESLLVKNPFAYRTERVLEISRECSYKLILNGTPISRNEADLFAQWNILDWRILGYRSYYSFAANHLEMDVNRPGRIVRVLNTEYLARKIMPYTFQCSKADVLNLPKKIYDTETFYLTHKQDVHYAQISDALLEQIDERRPDTIYRLLGAMQAITSGFRVKLSEDGKHSTTLPFFDHWEENPRMRALSAAVRTIGNEQAVIYCRYIQEIDDILDMLSGRGIAFDGRMSASKRQESKTAFKRGDAQFLVANKSCAQFGLNLQFCRNEIFYSNDWDWGTRAQAEDRVHRAGQTREVRIWDIYAKDTLDCVVLKCLQRKESLSDYLKRQIACYNNIKNALRVALHDQIEDGNADGKNISAC